MFGCACNRTGSCNSIWPRCCRVLISLGYILGKILLQAEKYIHLKLIPTRMLNQWNKFRIHYRPQQKLRKVMFSEACQSFCPHGWGRGGWVSTPMGEYTPLPDMAPATIRLASGWYASYWNVFLLNLNCKHVGYLMRMSLFKLGHIL